MATWMVAHTSTPSLPLSLCGLHSSTVASCFSNRLSKHPRLMSLPALGIVLLAILDEYCSIQVSLQVGRGEESEQFTMLFTVLTAAVRACSVCSSGCRLSLHKVINPRCFLQYIFSSQSLCSARRWCLVPGAINQNSQSCHFSFILPHQTV